MPSTAIYAHSSEIMKVITAIMIRFIKYSVEQSKKKREKLLFKKKKMENFEGKKTEKVCGKIGGYRKMNFNTK